MAVIPNFARIAQSDDDNGLIDFVTVQVGQQILPKKKPFL